MSSKLKLLLIACLCTVTNVNAQTWQWAFVEQQTNGRFHDICRDTADNAIVVSEHYGAGTIGNTTFTTSGYKTICTKYSPAGTIIWTYVLNTKVYGRSAVACDKSGNVYIATDYKYYLEVGPDTLYASDQDFLLVKLDVNGNPVWGRAGLSGSIDYWNGIAVDSLGNSYLTGFTSASTIIFGTSIFTIPQPANLNSSAMSMVAAKYDTAGNLVWFNNSYPLGPSQCWGLDITVNANADVFIAGEFNLSMAIGSQTLASAGGSDGFLAKLDALGNIVWLKGSGGPGTDGFGNVSIDPQGDLYLSGSFSGTNAVLGTASLTSVGNFDAWLAKLDTAGTVYWTQQIGSTGWDYGIGIAPYSGGVMLQASVFSSSIQIGSNTYACSPTNGCALVNFDASGNIMSVAMTEGSGGVGAGYRNSNLCLAKNCSLYLAGSFYNPSITISNTLLTQSTGSGLFLSRLQIASGTPTVILNGPSALCAGSTITLTANGATTYTWTNGIIGNTVSFPVNTNTSIAVTATAIGSPCPIQVTKNIVALPKYTLTVVASPTAVCAGQSVTLSANGAPTYSWNTGPLSYSVVVSPTATTQYVVSSGNSICLSSQSVSVLTKASPSLQLTGLSPTICAGDYLQIVATGADTYTWANGSNSPSFIMASANNSVLSVAGTNTLTSCSSTLGFILSVKACTGIEDEQLGNKLFSFVPNPAKDYVQFYSNEPKIIEVFSSHGALVMRFELKPSERSLLDVSNFQAGCYLLREIESGQAQKLVIQR